MTACKGVCDSEKMKKVKKQKPSLAGRPPTPTPTFPQLSFSVFDEPVN